MWGCMIVGECSGLVSCPAEIREGARGATWRHRDQREGGYSPLCTPPTPIQHRYCAAAIIVGRGGSVWLEPLMPEFQWRRLSLGADSLLSRLGPPSIALRDIYTPTH